MSVSDFEPYFLAWDSVIHYPNPELKPSERKKIHGYESTTESMMPCYLHKTCGGFVLLSRKYPPRICPECGIDTAEEVDPNATIPEIDKTTGLMEPHEFYKPKLVI